MAAEAVGTTNYLQEAFFPPDHDPSLHSTSGTVSARACKCDIHDGNPVGKLPTRCSRPDSYALAETVAERPLQLAGHATNHTQRRQHSKAAGPTEANR